MIVVSDENIKFRDLDNHWGKSWILNFIDRGYVYGYNDNTFKPDGYITRAEIAAILARLDIPPKQPEINFSDVLPDQWYSDYIATASRIGILEGYTDGTFRPEQKQTREEAFKIVAYCSQKVNISDVSLHFIDNETVSDWAIEYAKTLIKLGTLDGYPDNSVRAGNFITRAEFIKLFSDVLDENIGENIGNWKPPQITPSPSPTPTNPGGGGGNPSTPVPKPNIYYITVIFHDDTNNVDIDTQQIVPVIQSGTVTINAPHFAGYTAVEPTSEIFTNVTVDTSFTFHYTKDQGTPGTDMGTIHIIHRDRDNANNVLYDQYITGQNGISVTLNHMQINGWTFDTNDISPKTGTFSSDTVKEIVFTYVKASGEIIDNNKALIIVRHVDQEDDLLLSQDSHALPAGSYGPFYPTIIPGYQEGIWDDDSDTVSGTAEAGQTITIVFKYAKLGHTVYFETLGGSEIPSIKNVIYESLIQMPAPGPTKENYSFDGWYKDIAYLEKWDFDIDKMPDQDLVLYAKWELSLSLLRAVNPASGDEYESYQIEPNTWKLHGSMGDDLYMTDKIILVFSADASSVKWLKGSKTVSDFHSNGNNITATYENGLSITENGDYSVYLADVDGQEVVKTITISNMRDGLTKSTPFLLVDYSTATAPTLDIAAYTLNHLSKGGTFSHNELYEDINMPQVAEGASNWTPITGNFTGSLEGNGNEIVNLTISSSTDYIGLFATLTATSNISNLGMKDADITGRDYVGALAGRLTAGEVKNFYLTGSVKGRSYVGGIAGQLPTGSSSSTYSAIIDSCYTNIDITSTTGNAGGIVGDVSDASSGVNAPGHVIQNCYSTGTVTGAAFSGGIAGYLYGSVSKKPTVKTCYSTMISNGASGASVVGRATTNVNITNSYALTKSVTGSSVGARIVNGVNGMINNYAFANMLVNGVTITGGTTTNTNGLDITLAQATDKLSNHYQNISGWDFNNVWTFDYTGYHVESQNSETNLPILSAFTQERFPNAVQHPNID